MQSKHFLIRCMDNPRLYRHYTICNAMRPDVYKQYINCLKEDSAENFDTRMLRNDDKNAMMFTIKNYGKGVSGSVHTAMDDRRFEIKGPIGKGLKV